MSEEEFMAFVEENHKVFQDYDNGKIKDDWDPECRENWVERCNSQHS